MNKAANKAVNGPHRPFTDKRIGAATKHTQRCSFS